MDDDELVPIDLSVPESRDSIKEELSAPLFDEYHARRQAVMSSKRPDGKAYGGTPLSIDDTKMKVILDAILAGASHSVAAQVAGVPVRRLKDWIVRGESGDMDVPTELVEFARRVRMAESRGELGLIVRIRRAAEENWGAAAWLLERRHSKRWGKKTTVDVRQMTDEQITRLLTAEADGGSDTAGIEDSGDDE
jgi:hypothetical protein